jgi:aminoglycoside/choline kinase family phosphotransferase
MRTPRAYHADVDDDNRFVLVLEDLSGWDQGDQVHGASLAQAERAVTALAQLHAAFWNGVDDGALDWVPNSHPSVMSDGLLQGTIALYDTFNALFAATVSEPQQRLKARYSAGLPRLQQWLNQGPRTVIHGDFRMDNLFFGRSPGQAPLACCDWQASLRGKGVHDVAYFLSGSLTTSDRRRHERALLRRWTDALAGAGVAGYPFEAAWEDYRRAVLALWSYVVVIGGGVEAPDARGNRWIAAMVQRSSQSLDDLGCQDLLAEFE